MFQSGSRFIIFLIICLSFFFFSFFIVFSSFPSLCIILLENLWIISQHVCRFHSPESNRNLAEAARNPQMIKKRKRIRNDKKMIKTRGFLHFLYFCSMFQSGSRFIIFFIICLSFFYCFLSFPNLCIIFLKIVDHFPARVSFSQPGSKPEPRGSSPEPANDEKTIKT